MVDDDSFWDGGPHASIVPKWRAWMDNNAPAAGWPRATLTSGGLGSGLQYKHVGSLWRRIEQQWAFYLERPAVDIWQIETRLRTHPG